MCFNNLNTLCGFSLQIDIYSFAIVLWEMFCFQKPHEFVDPIELPYLVATKGIRPPLPKHCPPSLQQLMVDCWDDNPDNRPSFSVVLTRLEQVKIDVELNEGVDKKKAYAPPEGRQKASASKTDESGEKAEDAGHPPATEANDSSLQSAEKKE